MLQKYKTFWHVLTIMLRLGGKLRFHQKNIYLGVFEIFLFENWQFLRFGGTSSILLSISPANKVHTRK